MTREEVEARGRAGARAIYMGGGTILAVVLGRYRMLLDASDRGLVPHLCLDGFWEAWITAWVHDHVRPGMHAWNVGANCGYYTMLMADRAGPTGRVMAIEPSPVHCRNISQSAMLNGLYERISVWPGVLGDRKQDSVDLHFREGLTMNASLQVGPRDGFEKLSVPMTTFDALRPDWQAVDFAMIDVEGAEGLVVAGMVESIIKNPKLSILVEFSAARGDAPRAMMQTMRSFDFESYVINTRAQLERISWDRLLDGEERMVFLSR
jgi:FkbM family methyltransferase